MNENGTTVIITMVLVFIALAVMSLGYLMMTNEFRTTYAAAANDSVNRTGIIAHGEAFGLVENSSTWFSPIIENMIWLVGLIMMVIILLAIYAIAHSY
jgi:lipoprotein signal peptidase